MHIRKTTLNGSPDSCDKSSTLLRDMLLINICTFKRTAGGKEYRVQITWATSLQVLRDYPLKGPLHSRSKTNFHHFFMEDNLSTCIVPNFLWKKLWEGPNNPKTGFNFGM